MPKTKQQKEQIVEDLTQRIKQGKSVVFVNFSGLNVAVQEKLRAKCREAQIDYKVAKKSLLKVALKNAGFDVSDPSLLTGEIGVAVSLADEAAGPKALHQFAKEHEQLKFIGGFLGKDYLMREKIIALAKLPSRQELLGQILGSISAPLYGLVNVLSGNLRNLVYVLNAIKDKKV